MRKLLGIILAVTVLSTTALAATPQTYTLTDGRSITISDVSGVETGVTVLNGGLEVETEDAILIYAPVGATLSYEGDFYLCRYYELIDGVINILPIASEELRYEVYDTYKIRQLNETTYLMADTYMPEGLSAGTTTTTTEATTTTTTTTEATTTTTTTTESTTTTISTEVTVIANPKAMAEGDTVVTGVEYGTMGQIAVANYGTYAVHSALTSYNADLFESAGVAYGLVLEGMEIYLPETINGYDRLATLDTSAGTLHTVSAGETLGTISAQYYGTSSEYMTIFEANADRISNVNMIYEGQVILIPNA